MQSRFIQESFPSAQRANMVAEIKYNGVIGQALLRVLQIRCLIKNISVDE